MKISLVLSAAVLASVAVGELADAAAAVVAAPGVAAGGAAQPAVAAGEVDSYTATNDGYAKPKLGRLNVMPLTDEDNHPTPLHAKKPLSPPKDDTALPNDTPPESASYNSFIMSISMIVVSEIGDKTFLIAALMAMKHSRYVVFSSAFVSLAVMTILSGLVGHALPTLLSRRLTQFLASGLFLVFGYKLAKEGMEMPKDMGVEEELAEVEEEIEFSKRTGTADLESGQNFQLQKKWWEEALGQIKDLASFVLSPTWIQVFVMTFLGEWGDRSQIATIAMAAGSEYWWVILGAIIGHFICTGAACLGGKLLAKKISMRNVTLGGAIAFLIFAVLYFYSAWYDLE